MSVDRRRFIEASSKFLLLTGAAATAFEHVLAGEPEAAPNYNLSEHWWGMSLDVEKCIGCGNCVRACKEENDVPREPLYFRTWVERYHVPGGDIEHPEVDSHNGGYDGFPE
jgi:ferredoxin